MSGNKRAAAERGDFASCLTWEIGVYILLSLILFDAGCGMGETGGVIRVSQGWHSQFSVPSALEWVAVTEKSLNHREHRGAQGTHRGNPGCEVLVLSRQPLVRAKKMRG